jgi:site-specific DNA-adenine methylase
MNQTENKMAYFGGKSQDGVYQTIINQIPEHRIYIEPFLGGGGIMLKKRSAKESIGIEKNPYEAKAFSSLLPGAKVLNGCGIEFLRSIAGNNNYSDSRTFIYCDPPYLHRNRGKTRYKFEMLDQEHIDLLEILKQLSCNVAISTYPNEIYSELLEGWRLLEFNTTDRSGKARTEHLYMNYSEPLILHDDRYIGKDAQRRQNLDRKIKRNIKKFLAYPSRERLKFLKALFNELPDFEREYLLSCLQRQK